MATADARDTHCTGSYSCIRTSRHACGNAQGRGTAPAATRDGSVIRVAIHGNRNSATARVRVPHVSTNDKKLNSNELRALNLMNAAEHTFFPVMVRRQAPVKLVPEIPQRCHLQAAQLVRHMAGSGKGLPAVGCRDLLATAATHDAAAFDADTSPLTMCRRQSLCRAQRQTSVIGQSGQTVCAVLVWSAAACTLGKSPSRPVLAATRSFAVRIPAEEAATHDAPYPRCRSYAVMGRPTLMRGERSASTPASLSARRRRRAAFAWRSGHR